MKYLPLILLLFFFKSIEAQVHPKKILITYQSKTDHTKTMAEEVAKGVQSVEGVSLKLKRISETSHKDLLEADAIIVGSPVYNANVAPEVVKFMSEWPFSGNPLKNKIGAAFVTAGGISAGEELAQLNLLHSMLVFGMIIVGGNDLLRNGFSPAAFEMNLNETLRQIERIGATVMLLELHDPTEIVPMPRLVARVCRRRVNAVNRTTRKLAHRYSAVLLPTRSLETIYSRDKWHVDRMHPSRLGHQFIADNFAHLLRTRGFEIDTVKVGVNNNRSRKDSIIWMLKNGTPWFLKRSIDLLPALLFLSIAELIYIYRHRGVIESADLYFPDFSPETGSSPQGIERARVS
jgi:lysophospholipase L1-like esterase